MAITPLQCHHGDLFCRCTRLDTFMAASRSGITNRPADWLALWPTATSLAVRDDACITELGLVGRAGHRRAPFTLNN